jgi:hypothetical protein
MTSFKDINGLTDIVALQMADATMFVGDSATLARIGAPHNSAPVFSFTNWSVNSAPFDCNTSSAAAVAGMLARVCQILALQKKATVYYNGTNKI